jgi:TP901 family phage tail tape measure protein
MIGDSRSLVTAGTEARTVLDALYKSAQKYQEQLKATTAANKKNADSMKEGASAANQASKANQGLYATQRQLAKGQVFLANAWKDGVNVIDRRYLNSIAGMRKALQRFNMEAKGTVVFMKGMRTTLDDSSLALERFMLKGNLVTRTFSNMATNMVNMGKNAQWTGRQLMVGITAPLVGIASLAVGAARSVADVDRQLRRLVESDSDIQRLKKSAEELSETWAMNLEGVKAVQAEFAQVGFSGTNIERLTRQTLEFAQVGDVAIDSAQNLVRVMAQLNQSPQELAQNLAKFNAIEDNTSLSMQDIADVVPRVSFLLDQYGVSIAQSAALTAAFTENGINAVEGANNLKTLFTRLPAALSSSDGRLKQLNETLAELRSLTNVNVSFLDPTTGRVRQGIDLLTQLAGAWQATFSLAGQGDEIRSKLLYSLFGSTQSGRGAALMNEFKDAMDAYSQGAGNVNDLAKALDIAGASGEDLNRIMADYQHQLEIIQQDPAFKLEQGIQKLRNEAVKLGAEIIPTLADIVGKIADWVSKFSELSPGVKKFLLIALTGLAALGPLIFVAAQGMIAMGSAVKGLLAPFRQLFKLRLILRTSL